MFFVKQNIAINAIFKRLSLFFSYYFITQNLITIAILPIYSSWGIPFHPLSLIGNFIFLPFLSLYLILSFFIFVGFCFQSCSYTLIFLLKTLTEFWLTTMYFFGSLFPDFSFVFINNPTMNYSICWGLLIIFFIFFELKNQIKKALIASTICLSFALFVLTTNTAKSKHTFINEQNRKFLLRAQDDKKVFLVPLSEKKQILKKEFIEYTVMPEIIKTFGISHPIILYVPHHTKIKIVE